MITREQYLNALEVVDMYHQQNNNEDKLNGNRVRVKDWARNNDMSIRLRNRLIDGVDKGLFEYTDEVTDRKLYTMHGMGTKTVTEFHDIIGR